MTEWKEQHTAFTAHQSLETLTNQEFFAISLFHLLFIICPGLDQPFWDDMQLITSETDQTEYPKQSTVSR
jgi:hypothetical protein